MARRTGAADGAAAHGRGLVERRVLEAAHAHDGQPRAELERDHDGHELLRLQYLYKPLTALMIHRYGEGSPAERMPIRTKPDSGATRPFNPFLLSVVHRFC